MDAEMFDTSQPPDAHHPFTLHGNTLANGFKALESTSSHPASTYATREASLPAKVASQLHIESTPSDDEESDDDELLLRTIPKRPALKYAMLPTGLCYDSRMRYHTELDPPKDRADFHPEDPRRIFWIYRTFCESGLVDDPDMSIKPIVALPLLKIDVRHATQSEILLVHNEEHFNFLKQTASQTDDYLIRIEKTFDSIYFNQATYNAALLSAGAAIETCLAVAAGTTVKNAVAVIRPPGHHAECDRSMGFCHFDNVAVATKVVRRKVPDIRKVLIVDWDVHHGNGIQQAFEDDPNVLYISIHVHEDGKFYPAGDYGDHLHCGIGAGVGKNINIPWPTKGMGDADYLFAFQHIIMPVAFDFNPDFVIIAAGFDAAAGDQLGGCFVTPACYAHMTHMLMSVAGGKIVACLEGGYNLTSISLSALAVTKTLMGEAPPKIAETAATRKGIETVRRVIMHQSKYWRCLYPKDPSRDFDDLAGTEKMHDIIRAYQCNSLYDSHKMIKLWVFRERISKSFENQVVASPNYYDDIPLLVIFHDPPEVVARPHPVSGKLDLHSISLSDVLKHYIAWALERGFGVIDVNVPKFLTGISDPNGPKEIETQKVDRATEDLAIYLWENYIEPNDSKRVVFLGVGDAYSAILHILNTRNWDNVQKFAGVIGFISSDNPIHSASENFMNDFAKYYHRRSLIYVGHPHEVWDPERKRLSKKFGKLQQSNVDGLNRMLWEHKAEVEKFMLEKAGLPAAVVEDDGDTIMVATSVSAP